MTSSEQEALSRRYGNDVIMLLEVGDDRIAVFAADRTLIGWIKPSVVDMKNALRDAFGGNKQHMAEVGRTQRARAENSLDEIELELEL